MRFWQQAVLGLVLSGAPAGALADTWYPVPNPLPFQGTELSHHFAVTYPGGVTLVSGRPISPDLVDRVVLHAWNGSGWTFVNATDLGPQLGSPAWSIGYATGTGPNDVWLTGHFDPPGFGTTRPYLARFDGSSWTVHVPSSGGGSGTKIDVLSSNGVFVYAGAIYFYDGTQFELFQPTPPFPPPPGFFKVEHDLDATAANDLWLVGAVKPDTSGTPFRLFIQHFDGQTWTSWAPADVSFLPLPPGETIIGSNLWSVIAFAPNDVWFTGSKEIDTGSSVEVRSLLVHFDGQTFQEVGDVNLDGALQNAFRVGPGEAWAQHTDGRTLVHYLNGTWSARPGPVVPGASSVFLRAFSGFGGSEEWATGVWLDAQGASHPLVARTEDHGVVPDIDVNGQDGPVTVPFGQTATVSLTLFPGQDGGVPHDWWIWAEWNGLSFYLVLPPYGWVPSATPIPVYQGGLFAFQNLPLLSGPFPKGDFVFHFALDPADGVYQGFYHDSVELHVP